MIEQEGKLVDSNTPRITDSLREGKELNEKERETILNFIESQRRELEIEAALEKVRASSIGMHRSEQLTDVVRSVFDNFLSLGLKNIDAVNINILHMDTRQFELWIAAPGQNYTRNFWLPYLDHPIANDFFDAVEKGTKLHRKIYPFEVKNSYFSYMFVHSDNKYLPEERKRLVLEGAAYSVSAGIANHSCIFIQNYNGNVFTDEENSILLRFTKVFDQSYTRFLDLQKAEMQAMEALQQSSLDRIRAEIASMRHCDDLDRITPALWRELKLFDIPFFRCGVFIINEEKKEVDFYLSTPDGQALSMICLPFESSDTVRNNIEHWKKQQVYTEHWGKPQFHQWIETVVKAKQITSQEAYMGTVDLPDVICLHFIPFRQGMLYIGGGVDLNKEQLELVRSMADAFSIAYARYEDFLKLQEAKTSVELALAELKSTQALLIQSEKMALLGELTAGIAHEIQNPLNFVNNFSEINIELINELKGFIESGNREELEALAQDLADNEMKIHFHGTRADGIVKSMLQHSRKSPGQKEATDLNSVANEYLQLAYHGYRAKNKSFNAEIKTEFGELERINVIGQDIGRVLLNLFNNAFQAMDENAGKKNGQHVLVVKTKKENNLAIISVKDNGPGIPADILDKIFQPFFTTKRSGHGTGLGLSLSYDIIKAHGGDIHIKTKENEGAEFIVELPY
jgi:signal transduction histidine kinase